MVVLFAVTLFVGAALLFLVQPLFARLVLPLLGGTPAVWNGCMLFFQAALLAGYAYAHRLGGRRPTPLRVAAHLALLCAALAALPFGIAADWRPPRAANPIPALLLLLAGTVGLPFLVVSTTAPLVQRWFAATGHPSARDPYFLYTASNFGSVAGLL